MIRSMTGFGDASEQVDGVHFAVELRSLNNRYFKATIRLPEEIASLEAEIETILRKRLQRGSVTALIKMKGRSSAGAAQINEEVLLTYLDRLESLHTRFAERDSSVQIDLTALLTMPGVLQSNNETDTLAQARPIVTKLIAEACEKAMSMRITEGKSVGEDLAHQRSVIRKLITGIGERAPLVVTDYHQRLRSRVDQLLAKAELKLNETDLIREVAIFADRSDISEEINRMHGHLDQFDEVVADGGSKSVGRTLEFLVQEMLREANTIGAKCNDDQISRAVVEMKGAIDRIKEQAANVE